MPISCQITSVLAFLYSFLPKTPKETSTFFYYFYFSPSFLFFFFNFKVAFILRGRSCLSFQGTSYRIIAVIHLDNSSWLDPHIKFLIHNFFRLPCLLQSDKFPVLEK